MLVKFGIKKISKHRRRNTPNGCNVNLITILFNTYKDKKKYNPNRFL